jgi:hypothetical protein
MGVRIGDDIWGFRRGVEGVRVVMEGGVGFWEDLVGQGRAGRVWKWVDRLIGSVEREREREILKWGSGGVVTGIRVVGL